MSELSAKSNPQLVPSPPVIDQTFTPFRHWVMVGSQLVFVVAMIIGLFARKQPDEAMHAFLWFVMGWAVGRCVLWPTHLRQKQRISILEDRLSKLQLSNADGQ